MSNDYFSSSYFKRISVSIHIVAPVPRRKIQPPICLETYFLFKLRNSSSSSSLFRNESSISLGFKTHAATGLFEQDSSKWEEMCLSEQVFKPDWWEGDFKQIFCDRNPDFIPLSQRPSTPFYT